jgi:hypothetical protein
MLDTERTHDAPAPHVAEGVCHVLVAYEVGLSIDLDEAERRIAAMRQRALIKHKRRAPRYFEYRPAPLRVTEAAEPLVLGALRTTATVDAVCYDFGAVSVSYRIPLAGPLAALVELNDALYDNAALLADSRQRVEQLLATIAPAVTRPGIAEPVGTSGIFQVEAFATPCAPAALTTTYAPLVAQLLRGERETLSAQEVEDATACRISFGAADVTVIDWDATLLYDRDADDVHAVLEFANVELLEMRCLDQQLDAALDEAYEALARRSRRFHLPGTLRADLQRIGQLQVDGAVLFEGVNNALKLIGDQYLARVYRLVSQRFHLAEWDASILRKLHTLESIYEKMSDVAANWRMEILEWIIIILIAVSIVIPFIPGVPGHW